MPVRLLFDRQESGDCSSRMVFSDFKVNQVLPAFETTTVELLPEEPGEYQFACGMNMLHGKLRVVGEAAPGGVQVVDRSLGEGYTPDVVRVLPGVSADTEEGPGPAVDPRLGAHAATWRRRWSGRRQPSKGPVGDRRARLNLA